MGMGIKSGHPSRLGIQGIKSELNLCLSLIQYPEYLSSIYYVHFQFICIIYRIMNSTSLCSFKGVNLYRNTLCPARSNQLQRRASANNITRIDQPVFNTKNKIISFILSIFYVHICEMLNVMRNLVKTSQDLV